MKKLKKKREKKSSIITLMLPIIWENGFDFLQISFAIILYKKQIIRQKPLCDHLECFMFHSFHWACPSTSYIHYIWWWWWWNFFFFFDAFVHLNILSGHSTQISFYLINGKWESNNNNNNKKKYGFIQANYYYYYLYLYYYV